MNALWKVIEQTVKDCGFEVGRGRFIQQGYNEANAEYQIEVICPHCRHTTVIKIPRENADQMEEIVCAQLALQKEKK